MKTEHLTEFLESTEQSWQRYSKDSCLLGWILLIIKELVNNAETNPEEFALAEADFTLYGLLAL